MRVWGLRRLVFGRGLWVVREGREGGRLRAFGVCLGWKKGIDPHFEHDTQFAPG